MGKNWLIRTKSNHILGPVSKEKVVELYQNGSIKPDDEICSGNGYWFFIRESELVDKFLLGTDVQGFNPISEAKDVLTATETLTKDPTRDDITIVGALDLRKIKESAQPAVAAVAEAPAIPKPEPVLKVDPENSQKKKLKTEPQVKSSTSQPKKIPQQNYLKYLLIAGFIILFLIIYYRKSFLKSLSYVWWVQDAHAQVEESAAKKKSF
jgi:hypothetical protein